MNKKHKDAPETPNLEANKQLEETKNQLLRALADFDNYKKRTTLERDEIIRFSNEILIKELLPVMDGFERAIESIKKLKADEEVLKGISLIKRQFEDALTKFGVKAIETIGKPYDPNFHEAILQKETDGAENIILEEAQKGYTLHGKMIKPSMVIVSKKKGE